MGIKALEVSKYGNIENETKIVNSLSELREEGVTRIPYMRMRVRGT